ncbi:MAG TPA: hypothetical protein VMQ99_25565 [Acetobacteraceae bacterium]|jgi:hypothetical protein|nr:hypothetical protein [Acetobacteraceae bacterium]
MTERSGGLPPARVEVTTKFLAEAAARQRAYETRRRIWTATFHPSEPRAQAAARSRRIGRIHDPRQGKFDL